MWVSHRQNTIQRRLRLDWMLVSVGLMAAMVLAATMIRTASDGSDAGFIPQMGGLRALDATERLIIFEDYTAAGGASWSTGQNHDAITMLGAVWLATPPDAPLMRALNLPKGAARAVVSFDLIAVDRWTDESLAIAVQGQTLLRHQFSSKPQTPALALRASDGIALRTRASTLRDMGAGPRFNRLRVEIAIDRPDPQLQLTLTPQPATPDQATPVWAVDNLMVIVKDIPPEG